MSTPAEYNSYQKPSNSYQKPAIHYEDEKQPVIKVKVQPEAEEAPVVRQHNKYTDSDVDNNDGDDQDVETGRLLREKAQKLISEADSRTSLKASSDEDSREDKDDSNTKTKQILAAIGVAGLIWMASLSHEITASLGMGMNDAHL